jgi:hypothetical protein
MIIEQRNNAITAYMGGVDYVKRKHKIPKKKDQELKLEDLKYHTSWDWMIPVWSKLRQELSPGMVIFAINCIDADRLVDLHELLGNVAIQWCKKNDYNI